MPVRTSRTSAPTRSQMVAIFVDERNLGGQHAVGGVLGHFGAAHSHDDKLLTAAGKGSVQFAHESGGLFVVRAHHHAVRLHEVGHGVAFFEKFGVGHHVEGDVGASGRQGFGYQGAHPVGRAYGHRGLVHHHHGGGHVFAYLAGHLLHKA